LRKILSTILRGGKDADEFIVAYIHRGAPEDTLRIRASKISQVGKGWFLLSDGETQIPFHRILYVRDEKSDLVLWTKKTMERP
jgi:uncharacterized protein (UPF0248 family)